MSNLELWESVEITDKKYTKPAPSKHGKITAIDAQYQLRTATEKWGPYGAKWGLRQLEFTMLTIGDKPTLVLQAVFFYPDGEEGGHFPIAIDILFKHEDNAYKKAITEARSKALSYLGFNADVYLGRFDDSAYVDAIQPGFSDPKPGEVTGNGDGKPTSASVASSGRKGRAIQGLKECEDPKKISRFVERAKALFDAKEIIETDKEEIIAYAQQRTTELTAK